MSGHRCWICSTDDPEGKRRPRKVINHRAPLWCATHDRAWRKSRMRLSDWLEKR